MIRKAFGNLTIVALLLLIGYRTEVCFHAVIMILSLKSLHETSWFQKVYLQILLSFYDDTLETKRLFAPLVQSLSSQATLSVIVIATHITFLNTTFENGCFVLMWSYIGIVLSKLWKYQNFMFALEVPDKTVYQHWAVSLSNYSMYIDVFVFTLVILGGLVFYCLDV